MTIRLERFRRNEPQACQAVAEDAFRRASQIENAYQDLHARVNAARMWTSVYDTARFVLPKYGARASKAERAAATALLSRLQTLAGIKRD